jgi:hypothetical protein
MTVFKLCLPAIAVAVALLSPPAFAQNNPEASYIAARDAIIAKLKRADKAGKYDDNMMKEEEKARAGLAKQLHAIIGPVEINGVPDTGKLSNETLLYSDVGFDALDGIAYGKDDDKVHVLVTTESLLARWLSAHKNWWEKGNVPQNAAAAFRSMSFYTQALSADAAVIEYAELPITKHAEAKTAFAMLNARTQDSSPDVPDEIFVSAVQGGLVFIGFATAETKIGPIAACEAVRADRVKQSDALYAAYQKSNLKDQTAFDKATAMREGGDAAFRHCFSEQAPKEPAFAAIVKQAQSLYDRFPVR